MAREVTYTFEDAEERVRHVRASKAKKIYSCWFDDESKRRAQLKRHMEKNNNILDLGCCTFRLDQLPK